MIIVSQKCLIKVANTFPFSYIYETIDHLDLIFHSFIHLLPEHWLKAREHFLLAHEANMQTSARTTSFSSIVFYF